MVLCIGIVRVLMSPVGGSSKKAFGPFEHGLEGLANGLPVEALSHSRSARINNDQLLGGIDRRPCLFVQSIGSKSKV